MEPLNLSQVGCRAKEDELADGRRLRVKCAEIASRRTPISERSGLSAGLGPLLREALVSGYMDANTSLHHGRFEFGVSY